MTIPSKTAFLTSLLILGTVAYSGSTFVSYPPGIALGYTSMAIIFLVVVLAFTLPDRTPSVDWAAKGDAFQRTFEAGVAEGRARQRFDDTMARTEATLNRLESVDADKETV